MVQRRRFIKDPQGFLDYVINWSDWLYAGDELANAVWSVDSPSLIIEHQEFTSVTATVWVSGGALGQTYDLTCHITTTDERETDQTIEINIRGR